MSKNWGVLWLVTDLSCAGCGKGLVFGVPLPLCLVCGEVVCGDVCRDGHVCDGRPLYWSVGRKRLDRWKEGQARG